MRKIIIGIIFIVIVALVYFLLDPFKAPGSDKSPLIITITEESGDDVVGLKLQEGGFIKSMLAFEFALSIKGQRNKIQPGGYYLSKNMGTFEIIDKMTKGPDLKWILVPEGIRKEQIGEKLMSTFGWSEVERIDWDQIHSHDDYFEGVYFPDTYLIPVNENPEQIATRMINRFNENFAPYQDRFAKKNIIWTTGLKLASVVQREAAGPSDMRLISGILWNRLLKNQPLQIDATVQYAKGRTNMGWWTPITSQDIKEIDSAYNTYKHSGLPPTPISNPGIAAIEAALDPEETKCLYYLHDHNRGIRCSETYEGHLENIKKYLN